MKRFSLVLTILVTLLHAHLHAATFTASQIEITPGQTAQLVIGMNNTETNLSGFQFKLYLPEGLSVTTNASGQFVYTQSGRIANHTVNFRALDDGGYLVVVYSMDANVITGSSGELMSISVTADGTASTSGNGTLSNIRITDVSSSTSSCNDVTFAVTLASKREISFTLSEAGVGTLILPYDAALPDGLKAYKCVSLQGTMVVLEEQESITAHTPVLMQGEPGTYIFTGMPAEGDASYTSGLLTGVMEATTITTGYVLATQNGVTGFYKLEPGTTLPANRCYLQVEAAAKMLELLFPEDAFTLTCLSGSNFGGNEGCQNLFDGTQGTKWGTGNGRYDTVYTIFKTALPEHLCS